MKTSMKVLTIGNSFTDSLFRYFPQIAESAGCELLLERANFGGCEMRRHWSYITAEENDPDCRIYHGSGRKLSTILTMEKWDVVTIQQASHESWRSETFHPYAENIHDYVKKHAPQTEVMIQQTWSYHRNHPRLLPESEWGIDQKIMYERLTENYSNLGRDLKLRVIPSGYAVQLARVNQSIPMSEYNIAEVTASLYPPDLPPMAGALVGAYQWAKNKVTGELELQSDLIHLNRRGEYLQACVWFAFLFGRPTDEIKFIPDEISLSDAVELRRFAQQAVDEFPQAIG